MKHQFVKHICLIMSLVAMLFAATLQTAMANTKAPFSVGATFYAPCLPAEGVWMEGEATLSVTYKKYQVKYDLSGSGHWAKPHVEFHQNGNNLFLMDKFVVHLPDGGQCDITNTKTHIHYNNGKIAGVSLSQ